MRRPERCAGCGQRIEWVRDGSRVVPVDPGTHIPVLPGRGYTACYPLDGSVVVGRVVHGADGAKPRVRWGRSLHWSTCEVGYEKSRALTFSSGQRPNG